MLYVRIALAHCVDFYESLGICDTVQRRKLSRTPQYSAVQVIIIIIIIINLLCRVTAGGV